MKMVLSHIPILGNGRREMPENNFREFGGHKVVHVKLICHDFRAGKALIGT